VRQDQFDSITITRAANGFIVRTGQLRNETYSDPAAWFVFENETTLFDWMRAYFPFPK
jgi:hypothetical protein